MTFAERLRVVFKDLLDPIAEYINRTGLKPNTVTLIGLLGNIIAAVFLAQGRFFIGGLLVLVIGPIDALDGTMARLKGESTAFGAFVDSVTDRYSELAILFGILVYSLRSNNVRIAILVYLAAAGSVLVSYIKARAEGLGMSANTGLLTRVERYLVIAPSMIFNQVEIGLWILAIFANLTALQRILFVRKQVKLEQKEKKND